jgi:hypothetical protein
LVEGIDASLESEVVHEALDAELARRVAAETELSEKTKKLEQLKRKRKELQEKIGVIPRMMKKLATTELKEFIDYRGILPETLHRLYIVFKTNHFDVNVQRSLRVVVDFEGIKLIFD